MKKIGDIMTEMGFRKDAPDSVKEAFLKHLIKNSTGMEVETPTEKKAKGTQTPRPKFGVFQKDTAPSEPVQLTFDFSDYNNDQKAKVS